MPSTNRFRNFKDVSFASTTILGVKTIRFDRGVGLLADSADADAFITHRVVTVQDPVFTLTTTEASALLAVGAGVRGVFTYKWLESYSQSIAAASGTLLFTTNNQTVIGGSSLDGSYQALGTQQLTFATASLDGTTNPVTVTVL